MKRVVLSPRSWAIAAGLLMCSTSSLSAGTLTITFTEDGGGAGIISVSFSGSLDFGSGADSAFFFSRFINPEGGTVSFAGHGDLARQWNSGSGGSMSVTGTSSPPISGDFAGYGTGGFVDNQLFDVTGDKIATYVNGIVIDRGIASGQAISGSAKLSGTFAGRGITVGTSWTTFTLDGQANTLTYQMIGASSVPGSAGCAALIGLAGVSRRRRRG